MLSERRPRACRSTGRRFPAAATLSAELALCVTLALVAPPPASAALGEPAASVETDRVKLKASVRATASAHYTVHELTLAGGTRLREFVSADGTVFAVAWNGPTMPDLQQALGRYFQPYTAASPTKRVARRTRIVSQPDLEVRSFGRPRAFSGQAWIPQLVPAGVDASALQ
jgi:hypothetical protein